MPHQNKSNERTGCWTGRGNRRRIAGPHGSEPFDEENVVKRIISAVVLGCVAPLLVSCGGAQPARPERPVGCKDERPDWVARPPGNSDGKLFFTGISETMASESAAQSGAEEHARSKVVKFLGSEVYDKVEKARVSYGLSRELVDPVVAQREYEQQVSNAVISQFKPDEYHLECEWKSNAWGYKYHMLGSIPVSIAESAYAETLNRLSQDAKGDQAEKARALFDDLKAQGMFR
jgi:hypothetical protein